MNQSPNTTEAKEPAQPEGPDKKAAASRPWSPLHTRTGRWSWGLMAIFTVIYFVVAILTSKEAASLAATMIFGLPLGFILGIGLIVSGLVITRIYLSKVKS